MRNFVTFKPNCSFAQKIMVFKDMTKQQVHDYAFENYPTVVSGVVSEPTAKSYLANIYSDKSNWVYPQDKCERYKQQKDFTIDKSKVIQTLPIGIT